MKSETCNFGGCTAPAVVTHRYVYRADGRPYWTRRFCVSCAQLDLMIAAHSSNTNYTVESYLPHPVGSEESIAVEVMCHAIASLRGET